MAGSMNADSGSRKPQALMARTATAAAVSAAVLIPSTLPAGAEPLDAEGDHCIIHTHGVEESGELIADEPICFGTLAEALASIGVDVDAQDRSLSMNDVISGDLMATASTFTLGTHYDGLNRTSSSISVTGSDCSGGYVNLSSAWINRISSTLNGCPQVNFWDGFDKTGTVEAATLNLGGLNNLANSVQYLGS